MQAPPPGVAPGWPENAGNSSYSRFPGVILVLFRLKAQIVSIIFVASWKIRVRPNAQSDGPGHP